MTERVERLSDEQIAAILEAHRRVDSLSAPGIVICADCLAVWPCQMSRLVADLRAERAVTARLRAALDALVEATSLIYDENQPHGECPTCTYDDVAHAHQSDCEWVIARAALAEVPGA